MPHEQERMQRVGVQQTRAARLAAVHGEGRRAMSLPPMEMAMMSPGWRWSRTNWSCAVSPPLQRPDRPPIVDSSVAQLMTVRRSPTPRFTASALSQYATSLIDVGGSRILASFAEEQALVWNRRICPSKKGLISIIVFASESPQLEIHNYRSIGDKRKDLPCFNVHTVFVLF